MSWFVKLFAAIIVWVAMGLVLVFVGKLLLTVDQRQIEAVGKFLEANAYLLGFLAGAWFFIWGKIPTRPAQ